MISTKNRIKVYHNNKIKFTNFSLMDWGIINRQLIFKIEEINVSNKEVFKHDH